MKISGVYGKCNESKIYVKNYLPNGVDFFISLLSLKDAGKSWLKRVFIPSFIPNIMKRPKTS